MESRATRLTAMVLFCMCAAWGCSDSNKADEEKLETTVFAGVVPLTAADVERIIDSAAESIDDANLHVAVVDRRGTILGVFSRPGGGADAANIAVSLARTTAFFSNSQAPLSSRTVQFLSTFHFPPTFSGPFIDSVCPATGAAGCPSTVIAPQQTTTGIAGTARGPLWQINATNRGAPIETAATVPPTAFNAVGNNDPTGLQLTRANQGDAGLFAPSRNIDGSFPGPGITLLPGAVPLYKSGRLVGGVGVYIPTAGNNSNPNVLAAEFAAIKGAMGAAGAGASFFLPIKNEGEIFLGGILLPYIVQTAQPNGTTAIPGTTPAPGGAGWIVNPIDGASDQFGFLIGPRESPEVGGLTLADVELIISQCNNTAEGTRAAIRLPLGSTAVIIAVITDRRGLILAHFRMEDSLTDAVDVVPAKARSAVYYSQIGGPPAADQWPTFPVNAATGVAVTTTALGFLSQTFYPPGIDGRNAGPLFALAQLNQTPAQAILQGTAAPDPGYQNGLIFFPGAVPLYKNGVLVGGLGVSGDGVENNDFIAAGGARGFEPPRGLRVDNFTFGSVRIPYLKFPQNPGPGR